jgi:RNA polymerase sigma-70 factor (TIGR02960 family)
MDDLAFEAVVGPLRGELHAHCYRMLGSTHDAEDALQDALMRAWRSFERFDGREPRAWLYRIVTNRCLTAIERRGRRAVPVDPSSADLPPWLGPYPDARLEWMEDLDPQERARQREGIRLAFVVALQRLPPRQRAVLLLRAVLGFSAEEVAGQLATSVASVNSALQRARRALDDVPREAEPADAAVRVVAERYATAWEAGDVDGLVAMVTTDATYRMPPLPESYAGPQAIREFVTSIGQPGRWRFIPTRANGQLAFGTYQWDEQRRAYVPLALDVLTLRGDAVAAVVSFVGQNAFAGFDLPPELR